MGALGYRLGTLDAADRAARSRRHSGLRARAGRPRLQGAARRRAAQRARPRHHAEYVRGMRDAGYGSLPMDALINARDHGVTPEFMRELGDAGHSQAAARSADSRPRSRRLAGLRARDARARPRRAARRARARARSRRQRRVRPRDGGARLCAACRWTSLIRIRDHGVTPDYVRELKALGYDKRRRSTISSRCATTGSPPSASAPPMRAPARGCRSICSDRSAADTVTGAKGGRGGRGFVQKP